MKKLMLWIAALVLSATPAVAENESANDSVALSPEVLKAIERVHKPLNKNYDPATDKRNKDLTKTSISVGYQFFFGSEANYFGIAARSLKWEGLGAELGFRAKIDRKEDSQGSHTATAFVSIDPLANYTWGLFHKNQLTIYATGTLGPSFRIQNYPNGKYKDNGKMDYNTKLYFDLFINARVTVRYWNIAASVGFNVWSAQWKFKKDYVHATPNVSIAYCF